MPLKIDDPDRPFCPYCQRWTARNKHGWYICNGCKRTGTLAQWAAGIAEPKRYKPKDSPLDPYDDPAIEPEPDADDPEMSICYACETYPASRHALKMPATWAEHGLCERCLRTLARGRYAATQMSDEDKRDLAHRMAVALQTDRIVGLRPLALTVPESHYLKRGKERLLNEDAGQQVMAL